MIAMIALLTGCATGPMGSVGYLSYKYGKHADEQAYNRAMLKHPDIMPETKAKIFKAKALGMSDNEVAAAVEMDVMALSDALSENTYKWYEYFGQFLAAAGDCGIYAGVAAGAKAGIDSLSSSRDSNGSGSIINNGTMNNVSVTQQQNNSGTTRQDVLHNQDSQNVPAKE
jgi:hypothetical protein